MRKTFNLLFICLIALYGWIGYQVIHTTDLPQCQPEGSLSDVAEEVIAIPLKTNGHCSLNKIKIDRKSTRLNSSHIEESRMPSSA